MSSIPALRKRLEAIHDRVTGCPGSGAAIKSKDAFTSKYDALISGIERALAGEALPGVSQDKPSPPASAPAAVAGTGNELAEYTRLQQSGKAAEAGEYYQAHADSILKQKAQVTSQALTAIRGAYPWNKK
jgi:hypothetical protein